MPQALAPEISTWPEPDPQLIGSRCRDCDAGADVIHMAEAGFCADGDQEKPIADGHTEIGGTPRVGFAQLYGAPGTAAVTILST